MVTVKGLLLSVFYCHDNIAHAEGMAFEVSWVVDVVFDEICESLINGEEVKFAGFGTFKILEKNARMGRNPKTGASAVISARRVVSFRPSTEFRERVATKK